MARSRSIKPGFFANEDLIELPFEYRLLFAGLWTLADREGRLEDRPKKIKLNIFPGDNVDVDSGLAALARMNFIVRYEVSGIRYIQVTAWSKHQSPHIKETASTMPAPDSPGARPDKAPRKTRAKTSVAALVPSSLTPDSLIVPNGTMSTSSTVSAEDRIFEHWKTEYAHPKARLDPKRRKLITAALKLYAEPDLIAAISGYKKSPHHMGDNDRHTVYDDIENFLRDAKHIDIGIALSSDRKSGNGLNGHAHFDASRDLVFKSEKEFSAYERAKKSGISFKSQQQWDEHLRGQH